MDPLTPYYIIAPAFGIVCALIAFYGIKRVDYPGGSIAPLVAVSLLLFAGTLAAAVAGGIAEEDGEAGHETAPAAERQ